MLELVELVGGNFSSTNPRKSFDIAHSWSSSSQSCVRNAVVMRDFLHIDNDNQILQPNICPAILVSFVHHIASFDTRRLVWTSALPQDLTACHVHANRRIVTFTSCICTCLPFRSSRPRSFVWFHPTHKPSWLVCLVTTTRRACDGSARKRAFFAVPRRGGRRGRRERA